MSNKKIKHDPEKNPQKEQDAVEKVYALETQNQTGKEIEMYPGLNSSLQWVNDLDEGELAR